MLCIGRTTELLGADKDKVEKVANLERSLKERVRVIVDVTSKMKSKEEEIVKLQDQIRDLQG